MTTKLAPDVLVIMGSDSDLQVVQPCFNNLERFGISYELEITSAHRSPDRTHKIVREAAPRGIKIIIAGAGAAAHLAGVVASLTTLPVIGIPIDSSPLKGVDALYSTVQMPAGIPVATMAVGSAGAANAAVLAAQILAISNEELKSKLLKYKEELSRKVEEKAQTLKSEPK